MYVVLYMSAFVYAMHHVSAVLMEDRCQISEIGVTGGCGLSWGFWESNLGPLQEQKLLLTTGYLSSPMCPLFLRFQKTDLSTQQAPGQPELHSVKKRSRGSRSQRRKKKRMGAKRLSFRSLSIGPVRPAASFLPPCLLCHDGLHTRQVRKLAGQTWRHAFGSQWPCQNKACLP